MKKLIALLLALVMVFSLVACGNANTPAETDAKADSSAETKTPAKDDASATEAPEEPEAGPFTPAEEKVEFTVGVTMNTGVLADGVSTRMDNAYKTYLCDALNIDYTYFWEDKDALATEQAIDLGIVSEELPDMFEVNERQLKELIEADLIWDMTEVYEQYASDELKTLYDEYGTLYGQDPLGRITYDGKLMGIPNTCNGGASLNGVWLRSDWLDELDINPDPDGDKVITLEDLERVVQAFVDADPDNSGNPVGINMIPWIGLGHLISPGLVNRVYGALHLNFFQDSTGEVYYGTFGSEERPSYMKEALTWWSDMYNKGLVDPDFISTQWSDDSLGAKWASGQSGVAFSNNSGGWLFSAAYNASDDARFAFFAVADPTGQVGGFQNNNETGYTLVVNKNFEHPELAVQICNIREQVMNDWELYQELCQDNGTPKGLGPFNHNNTAANFDGKLYQYSNDYLEGKITAEEIPAAYQTYIAALDKYKADPNSLDANERKNLDQVLEGGYVLNKLTLEGKLKDENIGIIYTPGDYSATHTDKFTTELYPLEEEYVMKIIAGQKPVDDWDEFVELWHQYGGTQILKELNEALN